MMRCSYLLLLILFSRSFPLHAAQLSCRDNSPCRWFCSPAAYYDLHVSDQKSNPRVSEIWVPPQKPFENPQHFQKTMDIDWMGQDPLCIAPKKRRMSLDPFTEGEFWQALKQGNTAKIQKILMLYDFLRNKKDKNGRMPLHIAAAKGHTSTCQTLVFYGANVRMGDAYGWTPLHMAAAHGHTHSCQYLVEGAGACVNQEDKNGATPLYLAAQNGHTTTCQYLVSRRSCVNKATYKGWTPLYIAAQKGHTPTCQYLVEGAGANVDQATHNGHTPLYIALLLGHKATYNYLLQVPKPDVKQTDKNGYTPQCASLAGQKPTYFPLTHRSQKPPIHPFQLFSQGSRSQSILKNYY